MFVPHILKGPICVLVRGSMQGGKKEIGEVRFDAVWSLSLAISGFSVSSESNAESNCSPKKPNQVP